MLYALQLFLNVDPMWNQRFEWSLETLVLFSFTVLTQHLVRELYLCE